MSAKDQVSKMLDQLMGQNRDGKSPLESHSPPPPPPSSDQLKNCLAVVSVV